jgi:hypothetical protein
MSAYSASPPVTARKVAPSHRKGDERGGTKHQIDSVERVQGNQNLGGKHDAAHAKDADDRKPGEHDRSENAADETCSPALNRE